MGREMKRVPLDFDWPINKTWSGYERPPYRPCPSDDCVNGSTVAGDYVGNLAHLLLMLSDSPRRNGDTLHPWLAALPLGSRKRPGRDALAFTEGLAGRAPREMGHDAIDRWAATRKILEAAGMPKDWGTCTTCGGRAIHPDDVEAFDAWEAFDPPVGNGYQLWQTTSEPSPQTPVFATIRELAEYAAVHCTVFADTRATADQWEQMIADDYIVVYARNPDGTTGVWI